MLSDLASNRSLGPVGAIAILSAFLASMTFLLALLLIAGRRSRGLFWPRRSIRRYPGTIVVEVLDPIPAGLGREAFFQRLQQGIETATARLIAEGERELAANGARERKLAPSP